MKENEREESKGMTEKEQITFLIGQYTDLQRIKVANPGGAAVRTKAKTESIA